MRKNCLFSLILSLAIVGGASAQCSGPAQRTALINLQKVNEAEGTRAGQIPLTDTCGNQRYAQYVEINLTPIGYQPTTTGNTLNLSEFVVSTVDTGLYYIDWQGNAIKFAGMGGGGTCDVDWLEIGSNTCPDAITDSIYTQKYVAVGARYVWPTAELLVSDSVGVGTVIISGNRNARLGLYDNVNEVWSTIDQSGSSTIWYFDPNGEMRFVTAGGGTPQAPGAPFVNQFAIDPNDTPLPTIQAFLYPNTRIDTNAVVNFLYTDPVGKFRSQPIDSLIQIVADSIFLDSLLQANWYTINGTTTNNLRIAQIKRSAWWRADGADVDSVGFIRFQFGVADGSRANLNKDSAAIYFVGDNSNLAYFSAKQDSAIMAFSPYDADEEINLIHSIIAADTGLVLRTSDVVPRAIGMATDTVNLVGSFDADNFRINFLSENSYLFADSLKVVAIGQFPDFPAVNFSDGTEKGFYYAPNTEVGLYNGDGATGDRVHATLSPFSFLVESTDATTDFEGSLYLDYTGFEANIEDNNTGARTIISNSVSGTNAQATQAAFNGNNQTAIFKANYDSNNPEKFLTMSREIDGGDYFTSVYLGIHHNIPSILFQSLTEGFGVQTVLQGTPYKVFNWIRVELSGGDTTINAISFYDSSYTWVNDIPSPTIADTSFHFWAGDGTGTEPGFMTLDDIRGGGGVNIYNSDGTTTDNTRIADVLETLTFRSADVTVDGVYPFRFELDGVSPNEPEMMVWKFPTDSATLYQSDQELTLRSTTQWLFRSDAQTTVWADSFFYLNQGVGAFTITRYNKITQGSVSAQGGKADYLANSTITGVSQTELFLDGTSALLVVPANTNFNFEIHISAICSTAGNGVGITTGDAWESWHVGGIKRIGGTTSLVGTVQLPASAQSDAGMSTSVVTIDADDTDDSLRLRFTPPSTAGTTTVLRVIATISVTQISY